MKHLHHIFLLIFLCLGMIAISLEEQPDARIASESQTGDPVGYSISSTSFIESTDCTTAATHRSLFNDENSNHWISDALCLGSFNTHIHALSKFFKLKFHLPAGQLEHLLSKHLSAGEISNLSFTPSALRYSCGYYIYALEQILI